MNSIGIIEWSQSNRADILAHGVSDVDWKHYKHLLPEHAYDVLHAVGDVNFQA